MLGPISRSLSILLRARRVATGKRTAYMDVVRKRRFITRCASSALSVQQGHSSAVGRSQRGPSSTRASGAAGLEMYPTGGLGSRIGSVSPPEG
jgi:hypothetical protein